MNPGLLYEGVWPTASNRYGHTYHTSFTIFCVNKFKQILNKIYSQTKADLSHAISWIAVYQCGGKMLFIVCLYCLIIYILVFTLRRSWNCLRVNIDPALYSVIVVKRPLSLLPTCPKTNTCSVSSNLKYLALCQPCLFSRNSSHLKLFEMYCVIYCVVKMIQQPFIFLY